MPTGDTHAVSQRSVAISVPFDRLISQSQHG
jgi:hypothetical protein